MTLPLHGESKTQRDFLLVSEVPSGRGKGCLWVLLPPWGPPTLASGASSHVSDSHQGRPQGLGEQVDHAGGMWGWRGPERLPPEND